MLSLACFSLWFLTALFSSALLLGQLGLQLGLVGSQAAVHLLLLLQLLAQLQHSAVQLSAPEHTQGRKTSDPLQTSILKTVSIVWGGVYCCSSFKNPETLGLLHSNNGF